MVQFRRKKICFYSSVCSIVIYLVIVYSSRQRIITSGKNNYNSIPPFSDPYFNSSQYVIYSCDAKLLCGGFADRQKGIVAAYIMSLMMHRRFAIKFTTPCDLKLMYEPNHVFWIVNTEELTNKPYRKIIALDQNGDKLRKSLINKNLTKNFHEDVLYLTTNLEFVHYLRQNKKYQKELKWMEHLSNSEIYNLVWQRLFKLKSRFKERLAPFVQIQNRGLKLVGAQIRLGRNPSIPHDSEVLNLLKNIDVLWKFYSKYNDSSNYRIFISTDSQQVREIAQKLFPEVYVEIPGNIVHVDRNRGKNVCLGLSKVILDQIVLSICDVLVISRSGLGRIAAFFRQNENDLYCLDHDEIFRCTTQSSHFAPFTW